MGQGMCAWAVAVLTICLLGVFPPAFATGRQAGGTTETLAAAQSEGLHSEQGLAAGPCPTRFDYVVLASFADASNLLSLSTYHFRSEVSFSDVPLAGWQQVDFKVEPAGSGCRSRAISQRRQTG